MRLLLCTTAVLALSACATTSFAPPIVDMKNQLESRRHQTFVGAVCTPERMAMVDKKGNVLANADGSPRYVTFGRDVDGALALIDNYILTYRCQRDRASEGRQFFEVPAFLATAAGVAAAAFGAPPGVAVGTATGAAALGSGKSYYAPKDKAKVLSDGITAMLCIHNEAVGIDGPTLTAISDVQRSTAVPDTPPPQTPPVTPPPNTTPPNPVTPNPAPTGNADGGDSSDQPNQDAFVSVGYDRQYYNLISTALWSVEQYVADRLSNSGKEFEMKGILAELDKLKQDEADAAKAANPKNDPAKVADPVVNAPAPTPPPGTAQAFVDNQNSKYGAAMQKVATFDKEQIGQTIIQLKVLKPKLDQCILLAKL
jgi:hypothetical protein